MSLFPKGYPNDLNLFILIYFMSLFVMFWILNVVSTKKILMLVPQASLQMLAGVFVTLCFIRWTDDTPSFDPNLFYFLLLPPIIFNTGLELNARAFYQNFFTIMVYANIGTLINALLVAFIVFQSGKNDMSLRLNIPEAISYGALISATDPVTTIAVFERLKVEPNLYTIVVVVSVIDDAVAVILFDLFTHIALNDSETSAAFILSELGRFVAKLFGSMFLGYGLGIAFAFFLKYQPTLPNRNPLFLATLCCFVYITYLIADVITISGIISSLFAGIALRKYYDLYAPQQYAVIRAAINGWSYIFESFVFFDIGLTLFHHVPVDMQDWQFIGWSLLSFLVGRIAQIYPLAVIVNLYNGRHGWMIPGDDKPMDEKKQQQSSRSKQRRKQRLTTTVASGNQTPADDHGRHRELSQLSQDDNNSRQNGSCSQASSIGDEEEEEEEEQAAMTAEQQRLREGDRNRRLDACWACLLSFFQGDNEPAAAASPTSNLSPTALAALNRHHQQQQHSQQQQMRRMPVPTKEEEVGGGDAREDGLVEPEEQEGGGDIELGTCKRRTNRSKADEQSNKQSADKQIEKNKKKQPSHANLQLREPSNIQTHNNNNNNNHNNHNNNNKGGGGSTPTALPTAAPTTQFALMRSLIDIGNDRPLPERLPSQLHHQPMQPAAQSRQSPVPVGAVDSQHQQQQHMQMMQTQMFRIESVDREAAGVTPSPQPSIHGEVSRSMDVQQQIDSNAGLTLPPLPSPRLKQPASDLPDQQEHHPAEQKQLSSKSPSPTSLRGPASATSAPPPSESRLRQEEIVHGRRQKNPRGVYLSFGYQHILLFAGLRGPIAYATARLFSDNEGHRNSIIAATNFAVATTTFLLGILCIPALDWFNIKYGVGFEEAYEQQQQLEEEEEEQLPRGRRRRTRKLMTMHEDESVAESLEDDERYLAAIEEEEGEEEEGDDHELAVEDIEEGRLAIGTGVAAAVGGAGSYHGGSNHGGSHHEYEGEGEGGGNGEEELMDDNSSSASVAGVVILQHHHHQHQHQLEQDNQSHSSHSQHSGSGSSSHHHPTQHHRYSTADHGSGGSSSNSSTRHVQSQPSSAQPQQQQPQPSSSSATRPISSATSTSKTRKPFVKLSFPTTARMEDILDWISRCEEIIIKSHFEQPPPAITASASSSSSATNATTAPLPLTSGPMTLSPSSVTSSASSGSAASATGSASVRGGSHHTVYPYHVATTTTTKSLASSSIASSQEEYHHTHLQQQQQQLNSLEEGSNAASDDFSAATPEQQQYYYFHHNHHVQQQQQQQVVGYRQASHPPLPPSGPSSLSSSSPKSSHHQQKTTTTRTLLEDTVVMKEDDNED